MIPKMEANNNAANFALNRPQQQQPNSFQPQQQQQEYLNLGPRLNVTHPPQPQTNASSALKRAEFTTEEKVHINANLAKYLSPDFTTNRAGPGGSRLTYIETWRIKNMANSIFGFDGWSSTISDVTVDFLDESKDGRVAVGVSVICRVTLKDGTAHEDIGYGGSDNLKSKVLSFEKAKKEAVSDALKRAMTSFGNVLGTCLYDKNYCKFLSKQRSEVPQYDPNDWYKYPSDMNARHQQFNQQQQQSNNQQPIQNNNQQAHQNNQQQQQQQQSNLPQLQRNQQQQQHNQRQNMNPQQQQNNLLQQENQQQHANQQQQLSNVQHQKQLQQPSRLPTMGGESSGNRLPTPPKSLSNAPYKPSPSTANTAPASTLSAPTPLVVQQSTSIEAVGQGFHEKNLEMQRLAVKIKIEDVPQPATDIPDDDLPLDLFMGADIEDSKEYRPESPCFSELDLGITAEMWMEGDSPVKPRQDRPTLQRTSNVPSTPENARSKTNSGSFSRTVSSPSLVQTTPTKSNGGANQRSANHFGGTALVPPAPLQFSDLSEAGQKRKFMFGGGQGQVDAGYNGPKRIGLA
ncbi:DNA repair protein rad52 [Podila epigama]|nr:DNA repair protein rad52 [Podila epigama]